jgi:lathosterol oxidase
MYNKYVTIIIMKQMLPNMIKFTVLTIIIFCALSLRYFLVSWPLYWLLWTRRPRSWEKRRLQEIKENSQNIKTEIKWSIVSSLIFSPGVALAMTIINNGYTRVYTNPLEYGYLYLPISLLVYLFLHDTYFYWTHLWLHNPKIYRRFHRIHHQSIKPTPWTSFCFDPLESIMQAVIIPIMLLIIPIHTSMLILLLILMTVFGVINHLGYEVYPRSWMKGFWAEHWITPSHHTLHHHKFNCNYGLYFRFWDKVMGTDVIQEEKLHF